MKKIVYLIFGFISFGALANAEWQQEKINPRAEQSRAHVTWPIQTDFSGKDGLPVPVMKAHLFRPMTEIWKWDTIFAYDTLGLNERLTQTFDMKANVLTWLTEQWLTNAWVFYGKYTDTYDAKGNRVAELIEKWQTNAWENNSRGTYAYDATGNAAAGKYEEWKSGNWSPGMGVLILYSQKRSIFSVYSFYRFESSFPSFINGITDSGSNDNRLAVFPNPASENITIKLPDQESSSINSLIIYGKDGREMIRRQVNGSRIEINVGALPAGMYFIRMGDGNGSEGSKFVKI